MPRPKKYEELKKICINMEQKKYDDLIELMKSEGYQELNLYLNKLIDLLLE